MRPADADPGCVVHVDAEDSLEQYVSGCEWVGSREVVAVESGAECLAVLEERAVDCVVSEYDLPDTDGLALHSAVREVDPDVPFVVLTSAGSETVASRAVGAGVTDYVRKSAPPETVAERLAAGLAGRDVSEPRVDERYRAIVETSPTPIVVFDSEGRLVFGNDALLELVGVASFEAIRGRHIHEFIDPADRDLAERRLERVLREGEPVPRTDLTIVRPDGGRRHVQVATAPGTRRGERVGQAILTDVTALHETERELRAERRFVESALDALDDVFYVLSPGGELVRWNERAVEVTGYTEAELAELSLRDLFVGEDVERVYDSLEAAISEGTDVVEATLATKQGHTIPFEFRSRRLTDEAGDVLGTVGIGRDISNRLEWEQELSRQQERLAQLNRANEIIRDVNAVLVTAESREEIEQAVCDRFAGDGPYRFAWVGRLDRGHRNIVPRTWAGVEQGYLDTLEIAVDEGPTARGPAARAVRSGEVQLARVTDPEFEPWREAALERGYEAVLAVPITYDGTTYGVLVVYAGTPEGTAYLDEAVLAELGCTIGYAINAVERKRALVVDSVLELDVEIADSTEFFCRFSAAVDCPVALEKVTPQSDGSYTVFITVDSVDPDHVEAVCERFQSVASHRVLTDRGEECVVELRVDGSLVVDLLATHGSAVRSLTAADGTCELTTELPATSDVRSLVETLRSTYAEVTLVAQRERTSGKRPWLGRRLEELLTERQQQVLETAYFAGYFAEQRESNGTELAAALGISGPTFHHHLRTAQRRLLAALLDPSAGEERAG